MTDQKPGKFSVWLEAARLRTLPLSAAGILAGSAVALRDGVFRTSIFVLALLTTLFLQVLSNFANDFGDAEKGTDDDSRIGPRRVVSSGLLSHKQIKRGIWLFTFLSFITGILLIYISFGVEAWKWLLVFLIFGLAAIWSAIKYTVGKSAYGYKGLGDIFVFIFFGFLSVMGSYFLYARTLHADTLLQSVVIGCLSTGVLHLNNMRDRISDEVAGKRTVAVLLGESRSKLYFAVLMLVATISILYASINQKIVHMLPQLVIIPLVFITIRVYRTQNLTKFNNYLKPLALSAFAYAILLFTSALL